MSKKIRSGKSVATLASAVCLAASGLAHCGGIAPKLLKTTTPLRVETDETPSVSSTPSISSTPSAALRPASKRRDATRDRDGLHRASGPTQPLRVFLGPTAGIETQSGVQQTSGGMPRTNHFFELRNEEDAKTKASAQATPSTTRSALIPPRKNYRLGQIQKNPLVVDVPPKLRQFDLEDRPLVLPESVATDPANGILIAREQPLPEPVIEDLDEALDVLSTETNDETMVRGTARNSGFGMLAIDQIGGHLEPTPTNLSQSDEAPITRYPADMVSQLKSTTNPKPDEVVAKTNPEANDSLRDQLNAFNDYGLIEDETPPLPAPEATPQDSAISKALELFPVESKSEPATPSAEITTKQKLSSTVGSGRQIPMEVDELIAAESRKQAVGDQSDPDAKEPVKKKTTWIQRLVSWPQKGKASPGAVKNSPSATKKSSEASKQETTQPASVPQKRSGGMLDHWLNRNPSSQRF